MRMSKDIRKMCQFETVELCIFSRGDGEDIEKALGFRIHSDHLIVPNVPDIQIRLNAKIHEVKDARMKQEAKEGGWR